MPKITQQWVLYACDKHELVVLSKPFKTREEAEKLRQQLPRRERGRIGIGAIRTAG